MGHQNWHLLGKLEKYKPKSKVDEVPESKRSICGFGWQNDVEIFEQW